MAKIKEPQVKYITDEKGNKKEVVISLKDYKSLIEELNDLALIAKGKDKYKKQMLRDADVLYSAYKSDKELTLITNLEQLRAQ
ncbi:MAG: hypothetical protein PVH88_14250 [Ignavibacteria bacterium]|jgi:hypothetical protein